MTGPSGPSTDSPGTHSPGTHSPGTHSPGTHSPGTDGPGTGSPGPIGPATGSAAQSSTGPGSTRPGSTRPGSTGPGSTGQGSNALGLTWADLRGRQVAVWGVGVEGMASLRLLRSLDVEPVLVEERARTLADGSPVLGYHEGGRQALHAAQVVLKSPGISRYDEPCTSLVADGVKVVGGLGLWMADAPRDRVVAVTGTKGKSTTSSVLGGLLTGLGHSCLVGGNIGVPPWDPEAGGRGESEPEYYVLEVSSYQSLDLMLGPAVVVVTSLDVDHLDWHHGQANYVRDKLALCTRAGVRAVIVPDADTALHDHADLLGDDPTWVSGPAGPWAQRLGLLGAHNLRNAALAHQALRALGVKAAEDEEALARAATSYTPLPSRLTLVLTHGGVDFVDDGLSTNVLPTLAALEAFGEKRVALLVGGFDRGIDYRSLGTALLAGRDQGSQDRGGRDQGSQNRGRQNRGSQDRGSQNRGRQNRGDRDGGVRPRSERPWPREIAVFTLPDNGARIAAEVREIDPQVTLTECDDLAAAVGAAYDWASPDGVVLLSPAAPSFGRYTDYRHRSAEFARLARSVGGVD